jgi:hypothetical protein
MEKFTSRLTQNQVMSHKNLRSLTKFQIILAREQFRKNPPPHIKVIPSYSVIVFSLWCCAFHSNGF